MIVEKIPLRHFHFIINHVFLPPKLPQQGEDAMREGNTTLLKLLLHCSEDYARQCNTTDLPASRWPIVIKMMRCFVGFEDQHAACGDPFELAVKDMDDGGIMRFSSLAIMT